MPAKRSGEADGLVTEFDETRNAGEKECIGFVDFF